MKDIFNSAGGTLVFLGFLLVCFTAGSAGSRIYNQFSGVSDNVMYEREVVNPLPKKDYVGTCSDMALEASVDVYESNDMSSSTMGFFNSTTDEIAVRKTGLEIPEIDIVAHEVSHFVDWITAQKGINDGETRAYLQGYFTECVAEMVPITYVNKQTVSIDGGHYESGY